MISFGAELSATVATCGFTIRLLSGRQTDMLATDWVIAMDKN